MAGLPVSNHWQTNRNCTTRKTCSLLPPTQAYNRRHFSWQDWSGSQDTWKHRKVYLVWEIRGQNVDIRKVICTMCIPSSINNWREKLHCLLFLHLLWLWFKHFTNYAPLVISAIWQTLSWSMAKLFCLVSQVSPYLAMTLIIMYQNCSNTCGNIWLHTNRAEMHYIEYPCSYCRCNFSKHFYFLYNSSVQ